MKLITNLVNICEKIKVFVLPSNTIFLPGFTHLGKKILINNLANIEIKLIYK